MKGIVSRYLTATLFTLIALGFSGARGQTAAPDLSVSRLGTTTVAAGAYSVVSLYVVNHGTATAPAVNFLYTPYGPTVTTVPGSLYVISVDVVAHGHSGRGGGITYTKEGYFCNRSTPLTLAPKASATIKFAVIYPLGTTSETWTVNDGTTAQLNLVSHVATAAVTATMPPLPSTTVSVHASEVTTTDALTVGWTAPSVGGADVSSSLVTATPVSGPGTTALTATVAGPGTTATLAGAAPGTAYSITVQASDLAGAGPASAPITFTTRLSQTPPGAPVITNVWWIGSSIACRYTPPSPGDSPIDDYEVSLVDSDGGSVLNDAGLVTEAVTTPVNSTADTLTVKVRAHNAAGWGAWSAPYAVGGL